MRKRAYIKASSIYVKAPKGYYLYDANKDGTCKRLFKMPPRAKEHTQRLRSATEILPRPGMYAYCVGTRGGFPVLKIVEVGSFPFLDEKDSA